MGNGRNAKVLSPRAARKFFGNKTRAVQWWWRCGGAPRLLQRRMPTSAGEGRVRKQRSSCWRKKRRRHTGSARRLNKTTERWRQARSMAAGICEETGIDRIFNQARRYRADSNAVRPRRCPRLFRARCSSKPGMVCP